MTHFSVLLSIYYKESPTNFTQALKSILEQTLQPTEIILIKDGTLTSELEEVIVKFQKKYPIIYSINLSTNQGLGKALNEGLRHCTYDIVSRMDTDDIALPDRFEKQVDFM